MNQIVDSHDLLWIVLDSLRYDVARDALAAGETPCLASLITRWEERHTPATFTWPAHHAFFSGFLPTPVDRPRQARLFASKFPGSQTISPTTFTFTEAYLPTALAQRGFHTLCIGGVSFFDPRHSMGRVLTDLFLESHWSRELGPESRTCAQRQFELAAIQIAAVKPTQPLFTFLNVAAIHPPNRFYRDSPGADDRVSHRAALRYVDTQLPTLLAAIRLRPRPTCFMICSDHGTAYGEDGYMGHRLAHPAVWTVPYAQGIVRP